MEQRYSSAQTSEYSIASSSVTEEAGADELEGFNDFTTASTWERLISNIEKFCRRWLADGLKNLLVHAEMVKASRNLRHIKADFTYETKPYCLEYFFQVDNSNVHGSKFEGNITSGDIDQWRDGLHFLQLWFGVKNFLIIAPQTMSGVVLDAPEATKLLSAVAIALSNCGSIWPAFVPVHDPTRKAYKGIQNMHTTLTRRFEADRIGSQVPVKLMHLEGLYELFMSKLAFASSDSFASIVPVHYTMKLTYRTHVSGHELEQQEENESRTETNISMESDLFNNRQWDDDFPWSEWYSAEDPVKGFELIAIWSDKVVESSVEMAEFENASVLEADKWFLVPITVMDVNNSIQDSPVGFASRLCALVEAYCISFEGQFVEDFVTAENPHIQNVATSAVVPPPTVLDRVLKDLFHEGPPKSKSSLNGHKYARNIKGAPLESLFTQFCLHSLWFGSCNIRAISVLWVEFVREIRWCWDELQPLPMMSNDGTIDLSCCLVHQKLQMLAVCINKKTMERKKHGNGNRDKDSDQRDAEEVEIKPLERNAAGKDNSQDILHKERGRSAEGLKYIRNSEASMSYFDNCNEAIRPGSENGSLHQGRRGSAGPVRDLMLLKTFRKMHVPFTQDIPIMTQDMHEERQQAIEALSDSLDGKNLHVQLEKEILASDMAAFKAANPESVFEDFIRWHSPGDWIEDSLDKTMEGHECIGQENNDIKNSWPPRGRLSERMSEAGNSWHQIWSYVQAAPASEQKPLFDPDREGEKVLHYLETLRPNQLLGQMICTAFSGAADTLNKTEFGGQQQMITKIEQFYLTIASILKPLQGQQLSEELEDFHGDLQQLCSLFEEIERLVIFAASLHQKLCHAHRLATVIFDEHLKHSAQRKCITQVNNLNEEFRIKQFVRMYERDSVEALFPPPSPSQSWRKVLSMGNFLNGNEPLSREVVFSLYDNIDHRHYGSGSLASTSTVLQTHKMYICGTSNDLQVAFAVTSAD